MTIIAFMTLVSNLLADCINHYHNISGEVKPGVGDIVLRELSHGWKHAIVGHLGHVGIIMPDDSILGYMIPELYQQKVYEVLDNKKLIESNTLDSFKRSNTYLGFSHTSLTEKERKKIVEWARLLRDAGNNGDYEYTLLPRFYLPHSVKVWSYKKSTELERCSWFSIRCYRRNWERKKYNKPIYGAYYTRKYEKGLMRCDTFVAMIYYRGIGKSLAGFRKKQSWNFWWDRRSWYKYGGYFFPKDIWNSLTTYSAKNRSFKTTDCVEVMKEPSFYCVQKVVNGIPYMKQYSEWDVLASYNKEVNKISQDSQKQQICLEHGYNKPYFSY